MTKSEVKSNMGLKPITSTLKHTVYFHSIRLRLLRNHKFYLHAKVIGRCLKNFPFKDHLKRKRQSLQKVSTHVSQPINLPNSFLNVYVGKKLVQKCIYLSYCSMSGSSLALDFATLAILPSTILINGCNAKIIEKRVNKDR